MESKKNILGYFVVILTFVIITPIFAVARWAIGFIPFVKKLSISQSFDCIIKIVINFNTMKTVK